MHPFLAHYLRPSGRDCRPRGTTGVWRAAASPSPGDERWVVDLTPYAGRTVESSLTYVSDDVFQFSGVAVDDMVVAARPGLDLLRGRRRPARRLDRPGRARRQPAEHGGLGPATAAQGPRTAGDVARAAVAREPEVLDFLASVFGPYPFSAAGSIVDDPLIGFALENQTRPIYSRVFFEDRGDAESDTVIVHELAHQWVGDSLSRPQLA